MSENYECADIKLPKAYLINLDRSVKRYDHVSKYLNDSGFEYERFRAIDGYEVNITNL